MILCLIGSVQSCKKSDTTIPTTESVLPADEVYKTPQSNSEGDRESGCSCWIEVLDAEVVNTNPSFSHFFFSLGSQISCAIGCPTCYVEYWSGHTCFPCDFNSQCCQTWNTFPGRFIEFNCSVQPYSNFQIGIFSIQYNDGSPCQFDGNNYVSITFRMGCAEICEEGAWYPVYSEPMTLTQDGMGSGTPTGYFTLVGCGCEPELPF